MSDQLSVRERVKLIQRQLVDTQMAPAIVRAVLMQLTGLTGYCADECRAAEFAYNLIEDRCLQEEGKANRAKLRAKTSKEYQRLREAQDLARVVEQLVISCRRYLTSLDTEMRLAR